MMPYAYRRNALMKRLRRPLILFSGGCISRNYPANVFPFRADSTFMYFFHRPEPNSAAFFNPTDGTVTLFLPERTETDALWHGALESFEEAKRRHNVDAVFKVEALESHIARLAQGQGQGQGQKLDALAVADYKTTKRAGNLIGRKLDFDDPQNIGAPTAIDAIAALRLLKTPEETSEQRRLVEITRRAHMFALVHSKPGVTEQTLAGSVEGIFSEHGCVPAYNTILSARGEILHNEGHGHTLQAGDIVLLDAGPEDAISGYCNDVTRCWPVGGRFSPEARDVYELVLQAELAAIAAVKPGMRFRDLHFLACRILINGLVDMGLLTGAVDALLESGAHAIFFPHGLGHQLGLDVHDLEAFGDRIHFPGGRSRSEQFGTRFLRMDMDLRAGMTFTIEPGLYFVPAILHSEKFRRQFKDQVHFDKAERFLSLNTGRGFGGIRIEDDILCTDWGAEVLTQAIPKARVEIEQLAGSAPASASSRTHFSQ